MNPSTAQPIHKIVTEVLSNIWLDRMVFFFSFEKKVKLKKVLWIFLFTQQIFSSKWAPNALLLLYKAYCLGDVGILYLGRVYVCISDEKIIFFLRIFASRILYSGFREGVENNYQI